jgi:hypothetical protein
MLGSVGTKLLAETAERTIGHLQRCLTTESIGAAESFPDPGSAVVPPICGGSAVEVTEAAECAESNAVQSITAVRFECQDSISLDVMVDNDQRVTVSPLMTPSLNEGPRVRRAAWIGNRVCHLGTDAGGYRGVEIVG